MFTRFTARKQAQIKWKNQGTKSNTRNEGERVESPIQRLHLQLIFTFSMEGIETSLNGSALDIQVSPLLEEEEGEGEGEGEGCYQHQAERNLTSNDHGDEHESGVELIIDAAALTPIHGKKEIEHEYEVVSPAIISVSSEEFMQINLPESNSNSRSNSSQGNTHASLASAGPTASPILASSMPTKASLGKGPTVATEAHGNINANAKINKASNQKLNETSDTEQSSIMSMSMSLDTSHFDLSSSLGNISLFNDAVEGLGDLASMSGIGMFATSKEGGKGEGESSESQTQTQTQMQTVEDFTEENDEPGRIRSDNAPFDEEGGKSQIHNHNVSKETLENMSAIARMRYQQKYGTMDTMIEDDKSLRSRGSSSRQADDMQMPYDEIQKERHERWRRLKAKVQREEAEAAAAAAANPTIMPHNTNARHQVQSKSKRQEEAEAVAAAMAAAKRTSNSTPSTPLRRKKPLEDTSSNVEDGTGLQRMFQPFADALQQSQSVMFDAADIILGTEELDDDDDCDSAYYSEYGDNDVSGSDSSSCAEDDYDNDDDSDSPRRRKSAGSTRLGSRQGRGGRYNDYETSDSEYSHETELSERHGRPKQKGANKTFLEVR